jgi:tellurite resistance protein TerC
MSFRAAAIWSLIYIALAAIFIAAGSVLLSAFSFMFLVFGIGLIATAVQLFRHRDEDPSVSDNAVVALARRRLPLTDRYEGKRIFTRVDGRRMLTPLFIVLVAIATTDFLFALDSIPVVYGVTTNAYLVIAANAFALLGLRPLFFLVTGLLDRLVFLSTGLSLILVFIGIKLVLHFGHLQSHSIPTISTGVPLGVITLVLAVTILASLVKVHREPRRRAHAGSLRASHTEKEPS